jgi:hypothetical protein
VRSDTSAIWRIFWVARALLAVANSRAHIF